MNVNAVDKASGKSQKITITNNKGRLSKDDIERLVKEAEQFKGEDELIKKKIEAKNGLENYLYSVKNTLRDEKFKDKFTEEERKSVEAKVEELTKWFEANPDSDPESFGNK